MKIAILGYSGSGKSTLARRLGEIYGLPVLHLDTVEFLPNWEKRGLSEKQRIVADFMRDNDGWVMDGNYSKLFREERLEQADMIVMLLFNRFNCLWRVTKRYRNFKGRTRPDMGDGCIEKLDLEFIRWILHDGRTKSKKAGYKAIREKYHDKVTVLINQRQLDEFLRKAEK
ncbi:MAG: DNA topology modulation protein [Ruminococcaceae bacterium]|nr:DNA topology modulation protein [Oscillospiraceae bacterium]